MTGSEITRLRDAVELLQCGRTEDARERLVALIRDGGGQPPDRPPGAIAPVPVEAQPARASA